MSYKKSTRCKSILYVIVLTVGSWTFTSCSVDTDLNPPYTVHHVMLYVSEIDESISFYTEAFDMEIFRRISELVIDTGNGVEDTVQVNMAFLRFPDNNFILELAQVNSDNMSNQASAHFQHLGIKVADIEQAYEKALSIGASNGSGIRNVGNGELRAKNAFMNGPDGESLELIQLMLEDN